MLLYLLACVAPEKLDGDLSFDGPGSDAWASDDVSCTTDGDCLSGEVCGDGVCQPDRCTGGLDASVAPLGESLLVQERADLLLADQDSYQGSYWVDAYQPGASSNSYDFSWEVASRPITDVTGGRFDADAPESWAAAVSGQTDVLLDGSSVSFDFEPVALAAGDVDGDGVDELIAVSHGDIEVCPTDGGRCDTWSFGDGVTQVDVAAADVDGDSIDEIVSLLDYGGDRYVYVTNADAGRTGQVDGWSGYVGGEQPMRVTAADLDGDRVAEIVGAVDGGWWGYWDDSMAVYGLAMDGEKGVVVLAATQDIDGWTGITDVAAADTDGDGAATLYFGDDDGHVVSASGTPGSMRERDMGASSATGSVDRVAVADYDGDDVRARLQGGPEACSGAPVPVMTLLLPPYDATHSQGTSNVQYGDTTSTSESYSDTVSLSLGVDVGMSADFFEIFKASVKESVSYKVSETQKTSSSSSTGARYSLSADPETYGLDQAAIVIAWGCFDAYQYRLEDAGNNVGGDGESFVLTTPTGGSTSLWSLSRFNAMAAATGAAPVLSNPFHVGEVDSYPEEPVDLDGQALGSNELLFRDPPAFTVSDIGSVGWALTVGEDQTVSTNEDVSLSTSASVSAFGVTVGGSSSVGYGEGYSLTVGSSASFSGTLPPLPDNGSTPEDEYASYAYTVTPWVYLQHYTDASGGEAAMYVQTYSVR